MERSLDRHLFPIHVDDVGKYLERIEADTKRQRDLQQRYSCAEETVYVVDHKIGILEYAEHTYVVYQCKCQRKLRLRLVSRLIYPQGEKIV